MTRALHVGVTATRDGITNAQMRKLLAQLGDICDSNRVSARYFHHGDCIGGDVQSAGAARLLGYRIAGHPPDDPTYRAFFENDVTYPERPYLARDLDIVTIAAVMFGLPRGESELQRSGTWATLRYARAKAREVEAFRGTAIYPDGKTKDIRDPSVFNLQRQS